MAGSYRIYGAELSPYSVKVRSYFRYKRIPHAWILRSGKTMGEFQKYARLPLIPLVVTPEDEGIQDSTPIIERLEAAFPEPSIHPPGPGGFLSALLEEYADEWGNKPMFHYRWTYGPDREAAARKIAGMMLPDAEDAAVAAAAAGVLERMVPRLAFVGSNETTRETIEGSFRRQVAMLEAHLASRPYVFGGRPAFADFGLWGQLYNLWQDPTPRAQLEAAGARRLVAWIERMLEPRAEGDFEAWDALAPTLEPLLAQEVAGLFLPWSAANAAALAAGADEVRVELEGRPFVQTPQKYHARSLGVLRQRYAAAPDRDALDPILQRTGCLPWLRA